MRDGRTTGITRQRARRCHHLGLWGRSNRHVASGTTRPPGALAAHRARADRSRHETHPRHAGFQRLQSTRTSQWQLTVTRSPGSFGAINTRPADAGSTTAWPRTRAPHDSDRRSDQPARGGQLNVSLKARKSSSARGGNLLSAGNDCDASELVLRPIDRLRRSLQARCPRKSLKDESALAKNQAQKVPLP